MTGTRLTLGLIAVSIMVAVSGCGTGEQVWNLSVRGTGESVNDDFDFVQPDDGGLTFRALDGRTRTDTWLANQAELGMARDVSPWDPDTDDDTC